MNFINYYLFAKQAAADFLTKGIDLNESIAKIAEKSGLSQVQIQRVVEFANHETNDNLRKTAEDKTFTFPVASLDTVLSKMSKVPDVSGVEVTKVAQLVRSFSASQEAEIEKRASAMLASDSRAQELKVREYRIALEKVAQQLTVVQKQLKAEYAGVCQELHDKLAEFKQDIKDYLILDGGEFSDIHKYAKAVDSGWDNGWDVVFDSIKKDLIKLGQPVSGKLLATNFGEAHKRSGSAVPEPAVTVVNGQTTLAKKVKQLHETITLGDRLQDKLRAMDNFKDTVDVEVKRLKTDADYQSAIDDIENKTSAVKALYTTLTAPDDVHSKSTLSKLGENGEGNPEKKSGAGVKARALMGLGAGHVLHSMHRGVVSAAAENLLQPNVPSAFDPTKQLDPYLRGSRK
jgi:hypothetical protein